MGKAGENTRTAYHLKRLMDQAGMSSSEVAKRYECGEGYIKQLLHGHGNAGVRTRKILSRIFEVDESTFLLPLPDPYKQDEVKTHKNGEMIPGSYGTPDLSTQRIVSEVEPTREDARNRLVGQLDKILNHRDQTIVRAITANLEAFAKASEYEARIAALEKELEELRLKVKILSDRAACDAPVAYAAMEKQGEQSDGGQP